MTEWVTIAGIRRARGIRGEVVSETTGSPLERFSPGTSVTLVRDQTEKPAVIERSWLHDGSLVLKFFGIETRTEAETLRGFSVCIPLEERPPAPPGEFYLSDLVGCRVETPDGRDLGEVRSWHEYGAAPLLEVWNGSRELLLPFTDVFYRKIDVSARKIVVELPEGLEDLNPK